MVDRKACPPEKYENLVTSHIIKEYYIQEPVQGNQNTIKSAIMPLSHTHTHSHTHAGFGGTLHTPPADSTRRSGARHPAQGEPGFIAESESKKRRRQSCVNVPQSCTLFPPHPPSHIHTYVCLSTRHSPISHPIPVHVGP